MSLGAFVALTRSGLVPSADMRALAIWQCYSSSVLVGCHAVLRKSSVVCVSFTLLFLFLKGLYSAGDTNGWRKRNNYEREYWMLWGASESAEWNLWLRMGWLACDSLWVGGCGSVPLRKEFNSNIHLVFRLKRWAYFQAEADANAGKATFKWKK